MDVINTSGRRKTSVARIYLKPGKGEVTVNKRPVAEYFTTGVLQYKVNQPFVLTETEGQYDVNVNVFGGGITGQAEAVRLAQRRNSFLKTCCWLAHDSFHQPERFLGQ